MNPLARPESTLAGPRGRAAKHVRDEGLDALSAAVVDDVADDARADVREFHILSLGTHPRALYIIRDAGSGDIQAGNLHAVYEERVQDPRSERMRREYLQSLNRYDLIEWEGDGWWRRYFAVRESLGALLTPTIDDRFRWTC